MKNNLTENQKQRIQNIDLVVGSVVLLGAIGGVVYAKRTGGGFWRYVGYWIVGSLVAGIPARLVSTPFKNKILKDADKKRIINNLGSIPTKANTANESDALKVVRILGEKDTPYTPQQINKFVELYTQRISKTEHDNIFISVSKKESEWNEKDKMSFSILIQKVINPMKNS